MFKNGLFIISIGLLTFIYSINTITGVYQWGNVVIAVFLISIGLIFTIKGHRRNKETEVKKDGNY